MHIKYLELENFKSYRDKIHVDGFSDGHNAIIGRNGAGKSNLFRAIQFVLCEKEYTNLSKTERRTFINEGDGLDSAVRSAYVEICFDNSDGRFKINADEVILKRTIGDTKDFCTVNGKQASQKQVIDYLETAGFSRTNPYYIVEQGKVNDLCLKKDRDRLNLLKKLAGTALFEKKKGDALKALEEEQEYEVKVAEELSTLTIKVDKLESEKEIVTKWRKKRDEKEAIKSIITDKEEKKSTNKKENYHKVLMNLHDEATEKRKVQNDVKNVLEELESMLSTQKSSLETLIGEKQNLEAQVSEERGIRTELEIKLRNENEQVELDLEHMELLSKNKKNIELEIKTKRKKLEKEVIPKVERNRKNVEEISKKYQEIEEKLNALIARDTSKFSSVSERDSFLKREIKVLKRQKKQQEELLGKHDEELKTVNTQGKERESEIKSIRSKRSELKGQIDELQGESRKHEKSVKVYTNDRRSLWRKVKEMEKRMSRLESEKKEKRGKLKRAVGLGKYEAIEDVMKIARDLKIENRVYGPVYELISPEDSSKELALGIDLAAGDQLNHIVCDTDRTCAKLIKEMKKRKVGRCTLKPLRHIQKQYEKKGDGVCDVRGFDPKEVDASPIGNHILLKDNKFLPVVRKIFGKVLLCDDDKIGEVQEKLNATCITLTGQMLQSNGMFRGGYVDNRRTRLIALSDYKQCSRSLRDMEDKKKELDKEVDEIGQKITAEQSKLQSSAAKGQKLQLLLNQLDREVAELTKTQRRNHEESKGLEQQLSKLTASNEAVSIRIGLLEKQLTEDMKHALTKKEKSELVDLKAEKTSISTQLDEAKIVQMDLQNNMRLLEMDLENNLMPKLEEINLKLEKLRESSKGKSKLANAEIEESTGKVKAIEATLSEVEKKIQEETIKRDQVLEQKVSKEEELRQLTESLTSCEGDIIRYNNKLELEEEKISRQQEAKRTILTRNLDANLCTKYRSKSISYLWDRVKQLNNDLKKFGNINELAIEQYRTFSEEKKKYEAKKKELEETKQDVSQLLEKLESQKEAAVTDTLDKVKKHFRKVFKELVPTGTGRLVLVEENNVVSGVSPRVSFESTDAQNFRSMSQLSGGQKALVALCFIFAIQRCDPAPFYLFDEIDQALDEKNRIAVANMIQSQNQENRVQFITTTFRPELVEVAETILAVSSQNKISDVHNLPKPEALEFIRSIGEEEAEIIENQTLAAQKNLEINVR